MTSIQLTCNAHQRPIGQGGFYTATLDLDKNSYTLAYDCGSLTDLARLEAEIEQFAAELANRPLDLLVLSHLDADHVNGVNKLLTLTGGVRDVFLPYLSPLERLLYAVRFPNQPASTGYLRLLADPVAFLRGLGAQNIYLVRGGEDGEATEDGPINPELDLRNESPRKLKLKVDGLARSPEAKKAYQIEAGKAALPQVEGVSDARSITISGLWKLRFFQKEGLRDALEKVVAESNFETERDNPDEERCRKFLKAVQKALAVEPEGITNAQILNAIRDPRKLAAVKTAYANISSVHNEVSLCLWHGPVGFSAEEVRCVAHGIDAIFAITGSPFFDVWRWHGRRCWTTRGMGGSVLTGDLRLKRETLEKFKRHYVGELEETALIQLPHHGSRGNLDSDDELFPDGRIAFVSSGLRSSYLHPHLDLLENLRDQYDLPILWSHERRAVSFEIVAYK